MNSRGWALVTGAARRIGRALAVAAAKAGYDVLVHHRDSTTDADETAALVEAAGRRAETIAADLSDDNCAELFSRAPGLITLLVNSASVFDDDRIDTLTAASLELAWTVNLRAPILLAQTFAAALPADGRGLIVNIADQRVWRPTPQFFSYSLSKAGLWAATRTLAQALAPRIRVNAIGPGPTFPSIHQTPADFTRESQSLPLADGPRPEEIGEALAWLIDARSVTGQMIAVDGGQHLAWRTPDVVGD